MLASRLRIPFRFSSRLPTAAFFSSESKTVPVAETDPMRLKAARAVKPAATGVVNAEGTMSGDCRQGRESQGVGRRE